MKARDPVFEAAVGAVRTNFARYIPTVHRLDTGDIPYPAPHHQVWASVLMDDSLGHTCIVAPPGHAKTNVVGIYYPCWWLGNDVNRKLLYIGNTADAANRQSLAVRDTIIHNPRYRAFFPDAMPNRDKGWSTSQWFLKRPNVEDKDPTFTAAGVYGDVLGRRCDKLILDDVMDEENAATAYQREKLANWVATTAMSRIKPGGRCITILTRWHEEDIADWCRKSGFTMVHMPALSDGPEVYCTISRYNEQTQRDDVLQRVLVHENGPALWHDYFTEAELARRRTILGPTRFAQMYQGYPVPAGGSVFQEAWWREWNVLPPITLKIQTWDTAFQQKQTADYSVCQTWGLGVDSRFYLLDQWRKRVDFPTLKDQAYLLYERHRPSQVIVEERASGQALIQELQQARDGRPAVPVIAYKDGNKDKVSRAHAVTGYFESGLVQIPAYLNEGFGWVADFRSEMQTFPAGAHDDQVDAAVMAVSRLANYVTLPFGTEFSEAQDTMLGSVFEKSF